ncbi:hypothetical protein EON65_53290 [archaeon]|nr:MAG: hypothetical protein EON65_53290 [archaeon]
MVKLSRLPRVFVGHDTSSSFGLAGSARRISSVGLREWGTFEAERSQHCDLDSVGGPSYSADI